MLRRIFVLSALTAGLSSFGAAASTPIVGAEPPPAVSRADGGVRLAQSGDVEIYYDEYGRRVIVDAYSGEIISVERPRRGERRVLRRELPANPDRYYLDDPDDMARLERDRRNGYGGYERAPAPPIDGSEYDFSRQIFPDAPGEGLPDTPRRARPSQPGESFPLEQEQPEFAAREPIQRAPLGTPSIQSAPSDQPSVGPSIAEPRADFTAREEVAALQILLDRKGASPGVIDGKFGSNVDKAIIAYRAITGENLRSTDREGIKKALAETGGDAFVNYTIAPEDAAGPFVASVPSDYGEKAKLERLSFTSVPEMLAERFHMDEAYLKALNPEANFNRPGTIIRVANIGQAVKTPVARIVADKARKQVFAYDAAGKLVVSYPATIGSSDTPSPTGVHAISRIAVDPNYTYNPNINFKQGENNSILTIPPGPNGPVGSIWIALDKPTYGIHGTPDPSKIGKTESHGCVRLTNWDATELAKLVKPGVTVEFID